MRLLVVIGVLMFVALSIAETVLYPRGCIYIMGRCFEECPVGTHGYGADCDYLTPEATCRKPNPVTDTSGKICDYYACYCDPPTVRDEKTNKCVPLEECTPQDEPSKLAEPQHVRSKREQSFEISDSSISHEH